jgi:hypothetical protein
MNSKNMLNYLIYTSLRVLACGSLLSIISCKKFVGIDAPNTQLVRTTVFTNDATANAAQISIYSQMAIGSAFDISLLCGYSADEFTNYSTANERVEFYLNALTPQNGSVNNLWGQYYNLIYQANAVIEGVQNSNTISSSVKQQLIGEAKFLRSFWYFYLTNLFGDVPLLLTTDYKVNSSPSRVSANNIYEQIIKDLKDAQSLLSSNYVAADGITTTVDRLRPTKWSATALLARVYLFKGDWVNAEAEATSVINKTSLFNLSSDLNKVYLKNSTDAIWQITVGTDIGVNTIDGLTYILNSTPNTVTVSPQLLNSFETGDNRKNEWIGNVTVGNQTYYFPYKYKVWLGNDIDEYSMVLSLSEQFLIRAEARAQQNKISEAQADLNKMRNRAGLGNISANDKNLLLAAIIHERQVELFSEWGYRWLDLKRWGMVDAVMTSVTPTKGGTWNTKQKLYPIPQPEININGHLTQNPGY